MKAQDTSWIGSMWEKRKERRARVIWTEASMGNWTAYLAIKAVLSVSASSP
ncbi:MAG: hypothetical protein N2234_02950 [Planctomycetota bacterium]|nr:hypothetical protein [Planctomycetota bacterium]